MNSFSDLIYEPIKYCVNNIGGTINLLRIMEKFSCKTIVCSSSETVYKSDSEKLFTEDDICFNVKTYRYTK